MSANPFAASVSAKYGRNYHEVRIAGNRIQSAGWKRVRAEQYVEEVLEARNDLDAAVQAVLREAGYDLEDEAAL